MWQFLAKTAKEFDLEISRTVDERYHIEKQTQAACDYLSVAKEKFGTWTMAAASYNAGMNGIAKRMTQQNIKNYYNLQHYNEPMRYVFRIIALKYILQNPKNYGFHLRGVDLYKNVETYKELVDYPIENLAQWAQKYNINYKLLKLHNPWLITNSLENTSGKAYHIELPKKGQYDYTTTDIKE